LKEAGGMLGVVGLGFTSVDFPLFLKIAQELGCDGFELCTIPGAHRGTLDLTNTTKRTEVKRQIEDAGLKVLSVAGYNDFSSSLPAKRKTEVAQLTYYLELAREFDCQLVRVFAGDTADPALFDYVKDGFQQAIEAAEEYDVVLALENHGHPFNNGELILRLLEEVNSPYLRVTLDTGNFFWAGHSLEEGHRFAKMLCPYAANVHLKDFVYKPDGSVQFVSLGEGLVDLLGIVGELKVAGYQGPFLSEYEGLGDPRQVTGSEDLLKERTARCVAYLQEIV